MQVWSTLKQMCTYAHQFGNRFGFLTTGKELLCCGFSAVNPPGVRVHHCQTPRPFMQWTRACMGAKARVHVAFMRLDGPHLLRDYACVLYRFLHLHIARDSDGEMMPRSRNAVRTQGGPSELVVSLADVVSCTSTDPAMGQDLVYLTKVWSHSHVLPAMSASAVSSSPN